MNDSVVNVVRPLGLKSPLSGVKINGVVEPDPSPLDVSNLFGIATIVGDWDQDSKHAYRAVLNPARLCPTASPCRSGFNL